MVTGLPRQLTSIVCPTGFDSALKIAEATS
jgi:hypothetical protein